MAIRTLGALRKYLRKHFPGYVIAWDSTDWTIQRNSCFTLYAPNHGHWEPDLHGLLCHWENVGEEEVDEGEGVSQLGGSRKSGNQLYLVELQEISENRPLHLAPMEMKEKEGSRDF